MTPSENTRKLLMVLEIQFANREKAERCVSDMDDYFEAIIAETEKLADNDNMPAEVKSMCIESAKGLINKVFADRQN